ncbi:hypothetical protein MMC11_008483 [Xylographa trunciseda]|nr:hypothetical protein [Xylographa trunciseda]
MPRGTPTAKPILTVEGCAQRSGAELVPELSEIPEVQVGGLHIVSGVDVADTPSGASDKELKMLTVLEALKVKLEEALETLGLLMALEMIVLSNMGWNGLPGVKVKVLLQQFSPVLDPHQKSML